MPARKNQSEASDQPAKPKPAAQPAKRRRNSVQRWAHSTLFVAGLAAARMSEENHDNELPLYDMELTDRLRVTITRYHE
jgi:hypothetical protein